ncbi:putative reverse transcriptase domain-containing protein [Tanacetum coccineum]
MPVELGSFDAIIGMDWLAKYQAIIVCAEKIVRIPWRNKTLIIHGDGSHQENVTRLNIISCTKTQKYMEKGFPIFFKKDFLSFWHMSPTRRLRQMVFLRLDKWNSKLIWYMVFAAVARSPYRLAAFRNERGYKQLKELSDKGYIRPVPHLGELEASFQLLKQKLCSAPILALPEGSEDFIAYCDTSKKGLGAVLMQRETGDFRMHYASLKIHEREHIRMIWILEQ